MRDCNIFAFNGASSDKAIQKSKRFDDPSTNLLQRSITLVKKSKKRPFLLTFQAIPLIYTRLNYKFILRRTKSYARYF